VDHCLDTLQNEGGINAVFVYTHSYQGFSRGVKTAADHGVPYEPVSERTLTEVWTPPHDAYYAETFLRHRQRPGEAEYADRDVLATLMAPARERGMGVYARILEGFAGYLPALIPNWVNILSVDVYGRPTQLPCWNNPDYRNWWLGTVEDLFKSYPLDGFKFGAERAGPLSNLLTGAYWGHYVPECFCEHCQARAREKGIDVARAREGWRRLYEYVDGLVQGAPSPPDGVLVTALRYFLRYPEILAWESMWHECKEAVAKLMYGAIKAIRPQARVGWHIFHNGTTWLPIYRAATDYSKMVPYSDWLKPVVYHDIAGPRIHRDTAKRSRKILRELSKPQQLQLLYAITGRDPKVEPEYHELAEQGLSPQYVYEETRRCVLGVDDQIPIYPGIGFDIPWKGERFPSEPERVYKATIKAFEAGASGLIVSREYGEMYLENLNAVKRAVNDAWS
jgi:hypothetical protein